MVEELEEAYDR
jgi:hypothetical protein